MSDKISTPAQEPVAWRYKEVINCGQGQFFEQEDFSYSATQPFAMGGRRLTWVEPLYAAPPPDEARALLVEVVRRYDDYRGKGVAPAPGEYQMVVGAIERIRAYLDAALRAQDKPKPHFDPNQGFGPI